MWVTGWASAFFRALFSSPSTTTSTACSRADPLMRSRVTGSSAFAKLLRIAFTCVLAAALPALAIEPFVVKDIRVEGVQRTEAGTVFTYLPVKVGERIDDDKAAAAGKALYATGVYSDVRLESDGDILIVFVQERAAIAPVEIEGAKEFNNDKL